jgi:hypothetical protein
MKEATMRRILTVIAAMLGILVTSSRAVAQEIQLTGPLAGAPAVRQLRLHRANRIEVAPSISFTLLDEYQRTMLIGGRLNYNITEWLAIGVWGAFGGVHTTTALTDHIQDVTTLRRATEPNRPDDPTIGISTNNRLTRASIDPQNFKDQLGTINWVVAPQITLIPFRGKLAIFQKIFVDTDAYIFAGPAFVGLRERGDCGGTDQPDCAVSFTTQTRMQIAPTFGLGLTFYIGKFASLGLEYRALPFAWNTGGFDTRGGAPDGRFPDQRISKDDREFKFNQLLGVNLGIYFPTVLKSSE